MKAKTLKRLSWIALAVILVLALALVTYLPASRPTAQALAGTLYTAEYHGDNGTVERHLSNSNENDKAIMANRYGVSTNDIVAIDRGDNLYKFLTGELYTDKKVAYLISDVGISYNVTRDGYYNVGVNSSNAIFGRVLDGNGYTVKIFGGTGDANITTPTADDSGDRLTRRHGATAYGYASKYAFTGFLVAQNYGTIANLTVDYAANHNGIAGNAAETLNSASGDRLQMGSQEGVYAAGIVTGLNGYGGVIDNVRVNVTTAFTAVKASGDEGRFAYNTTYAGGIAGRLEDESTIINCQVDIASNAGIYASSQGKKGIWGGLDEMYCMAIAGGIVGNIDFGTGKIHYCAVTGGGQVKALANYGSTDARFMAFAGGAAGGCIYFYDRDGVRDSNDGISVNQGQIKGIISSWTGSRFANLRKSSQTSMGTLFDSVGSDDVIESVALLYDLETLMDNNPSSTKILSSSGTGKVALDSRGNFRNWVAIFPTSEGGSMSVKFDMDNPNYDIRMHIVADGHDEFKNSDAMDSFDFSSTTRRYNQYKLNNGQSGGIIWSSIFSSSSDSSNHINLDLDDPIYAEIYLISSKNSGDYNYEFGTMATLAYDTTNDPNDSSLNYVRAYAGAGSPLALPKIIMTSNLAYDTSVFNNEGLWTISRGTTSGVALSQTYMPGTYKMNVQAKITENSERTYGYYNADEKLLAWQPNDYVFTILQGVLRYGDGTTSTDGWQSSVTFELKMNNAGDFDTIEFQRNGAFPEDSTEGFEYNPSAGTAKYTVTAGTGKNGTAYTFYAYKRDTISGENVLVAVSESMTVKIDTEPPEVSEIQYYMVEDGQERLMTIDEVEYYMADFGGNWTKNTILAKFSVTDNGKSGIVSAATETYIEENVLNQITGDRDVVVTISDSTPKTLLYVDGRGYTTSVNLQFNVDRIQGKLSSMGSDYSTEGRFNYSTKSVVVSYSVTCGASGWTVYYSYQKDAQGKDIWLEDKTFKSSAKVATIVIDWNMGNVNTGIGDDFKIKMVNNVGLYEEEVFPLQAGGEPYPNNAIGNFIIWLRLADIYIDNNLNNIYVEGENKSVADILQDSEEVAKYFNKEYDGTQDYFGKKEYKFYTDLSMLNTDEFYGNDKLGVIYSAITAISRPSIALGNNGIVPVQVKYTTPEVGKVGLQFQVVLEGTDYFNYIVYFTNLSDIDFEDVTAQVEEGTYSDTCEIQVEITKRKVTIDLADQEAFNNQVYYYGDEIPAEIEIYVEDIARNVVVQIITDASATANVDVYTVEGTAQDDDFVEFVVTSTQISIEQRPISVDLRFDGGNIGNIPYGVQAGSEHSITGTYEDVNGNTQDAIIEYYLKDSLVNSLVAVGEYTIVVKLPNDNYVNVSQESFIFKIAKGYLSIDTNVQVKDFTEDDVKYDLIIPVSSNGLYKDHEVVVTYYSYLEGSVYNPVTQTVEGKISNDPMTQLPTQRGNYYVKIDYVPDDTEQSNFFAKTYESNLIIVTAETQVNVENIVLEHYYDANMYTFDLVDAIAEVRSSSNRQIWSASLSADGIIKVQYKDNYGNFVDVAETPNDGGGWYSETGRYEYRITYQGNADYQKSYIDVVMVINKAEFRGITFNSVEAVYDGNSYRPTVGGLRNYTGLTVTFKYGLQQVRCDTIEEAEAELQKFSFVDAREYVMYMSLEKDGYETKELQATINIKKATMKNVSANLIDVEYDGQRHTVEFSGLEKVTDGRYKYNGEDVLIISGNSEGNMYATNVYIEPGVGASYYTGEVVLRSSNYEDLVLKTQITIRQKLLEYKEIGKDIPKKVPSAIDLSGYKGYYTDNEGYRVECALEYRDKDGKVVELNEESTLADGRYTVWLVLPNTNYYIDRYWEIEVGEINDASISTVGIIAIVSVAVIMIGAVVTAIVVVKKRKKAGIV